MSISTDITGAGIGAVVGLLTLLFVLGAAPVFVVRVIALLYPKGDVRRRDLVAEMAHVNVRAKDIPDRWLWLGESFARALLEVAPLRAREASTVVRQIWSAASEGEVGVSGAAATALGVSSLSVMIGFIDGGATGAAAAFVIFSLVIVTWGALLLLAGASAIARHLRMRRAPGQERVVYVKVDDLLG